MAGLGNSHYKQGTQVVERACVYRKLKPGRSGGEVRQGRRVI